ncbi:MAG: sulfotransferase [Candidatus Heimdallarchaeota archaeon]|nr:sulfotransferase [Candidatus Heimdallarchaeota archaeon]
MIGYSFFKWLKLLFFNGFNIRLKHVPKVMGITFINFVLYPFVLFERFKDRTRIKQTEIINDPIFIVGHWRTGTTHLHKLLALDEQFGFLTLTETAFPHLILGQSKVLHKIMRPFTPKRRPTDNVEMFPEMPHEHEFALMVLCSHTPILGITFPDKFEYYRQFTTFEGVPKRKINEFKKQFMFLIKTLTIKSKGKQLVLKNPLDTFRIKLILDLFPNSKFIHLYRNPYDVFYSTLKLHKHNAEIYALQRPTYNLYQTILDSFVEMYDRFYEDLQLIPEENFIEVKFEDLARNPIEELKKIYNSLSFEEFEKAEPKVQQYLDSVAGYQPSNYDLKPEDKKRIYAHWHKTIKRWGYEKTPQKI